MEQGFALHADMISNPEVKQSAIDGTWQDLLALMRVCGLLLTPPRRPRQALLRRHLFAHLPTAWSYITFRLTPIAGLSGSQ